MAHKDLIIDSDGHFIIDPVTREITNQSGKTTLMQYDHNSERLTFEVNPIIEGHEMVNCDRVEIHYINIATDKRSQVTDFYPVDDVKLEDDKITFSWLVSRNVTQLAGVVSFVVRFICMDGEAEVYAWNTAKHNSISISEGMKNSGEVDEDYSEIINQWYSMLVASGTEGVNIVEEAKNNALAEMDEKKAEILTDISYFKRCKIKYEVKDDVEGAVEVLNIYVPARVGYLHYSFVHTVDETKNANCWRLSILKAVDDKLEYRFPITSQGEWELAVKLSGRNDFSGGFAHGDEITTNLTVLLDGKQTDITTLTNVTEFDELKLVTISNLYDPLDNQTLIATHGCERIFKGGNLIISQYVKWKITAELSQNYMSMLPIRKQHNGLIITNKLYSDIDYLPTVLTSPTYLVISKAKNVTIFGDAGISANFKLEQYPDGLTNGDKFLVADNGTETYHKMYFFVADGGNVKSNDFWETKTTYSFNIGE